jgi:hypothetical protein
MATWASLTMPLALWSIFRTLSLYHNELLAGHSRCQTSDPKVWLRHPQSLLVHTVVNNNTMQKIVHIQTLPKLHHSYVLDGKPNFAQLGIQHTSDQLQMPIQSSPTLQTHWNLKGCNMTALPPVLSNSKILPPPLSHCTFIPPQKNSAHVYKMLILHYFFKILFRCNQKTVKSNY